MGESKLRFTIIDWFMIIFAGIFLLLLLFALNGFKSYVPDGAIETTDIECLLYNEDPRNFYNDTLSFNDYGDAFGYKYLFGVNLVCSKEQFEEKHLEWKKKFCWSLFYATPNAPDRTKDMKVVDFYKLTDCNNETVWRCNIYDFQTEELYQFLEPNKCSAEYWRTK